MSVHSARVIGSRKIYGAEQFKADALLTTSLPRAAPGWMRIHPAMTCDYFLPYLYMDFIAPQLPSSVAIDSGHKNEVSPVISKMSLLGE